MEPIATAANLVTVARTVAALALGGAGIATASLPLLLGSLAVYWAGDVADGWLARLLDQETRTGAVLDIVSDRLCAAVFYLGLVALMPGVALPVLVFLLEFMVVDTVLSLGFLAWPLTSPNYFRLVDHALWRWNWSKPAKAVNSSAFALLLVATGSAVLGLAVAGTLLAVKCWSLVRLLRLPMPVPRGCASEGGGAPGLDRARAASAGQPV